MILKDVKGRCCGLFYGIDNSLKELWKTTKTSVRIIGVPTETRTWYLRNKNQKRHRSNVPSWWIRSRYAKCFKGFSEK